MEYVHECREALRVMRGGEAAFNIIPSQVLCSLSVYIHWNLSSLERIISRLTWWPYAYLITFISLDTEVDAIDMCLNGHFLVVCEKNGNLHLIYVPQKRILLTRVCVLACISVLDLLLSLFCLLGFVFYFFPICTCPCISFGILQALVQKPSSMDKKTYYYLIAEESKSSAGNVSIE